MRAERVNRKTKSISSVVICVQEYFDLIVVGKRGIADQLAGIYLIRFTVKSPDADEKVFIVE